MLGRLFSLSTTLTQATRCERKWQHEWALCYDVAHLGSKCQHANAWAHLPHALRHAVQEDATAIGAPNNMGGVRRQHLIHLEITVFTCRDNATLPTPDCEKQLVEAVLGQLVQSTAAQQQLLAAGEWHWQSTRCTCLEGQPS